MLADQEYAGHASIHDDLMVEKLGFRAGPPIEGPTHFSQFVPLLSHLWGKTWFERGCLPVHFNNMVVEGESCALSSTCPRKERHAPGPTPRKRTARPCSKPAPIGPNHGETLLEQRMAAMRSSEKLVILSDLQVSMTGAEDERVRMDPTQHTGKLYPFSLAQKLERITENSS